MSQLVLLILRIPPRPELQNETVDFCDCSHPSYSGKVFPVFLLGIKSACW